MNSISRMVYPWDAINEDIVRLVLVRVNPHPVTVGRVAAVCGEWLRIVRSPFFLKKMMKRHGPAPLLGFFSNMMVEPRFTPIGMDPSVVSMARFELPYCGQGGEAYSSRWEVLASRHGKVLLLHGSSGTLMAWDPVTGHRSSTYAPIRLDSSHGTVVCAANHIHGHCHSSPWYIVWVSSSANYTFARRWSSVTRLWEEWAPYVATVGHVEFCPSVLVGRVCYWHLSNNSIIGYNNEKNTLHPISLPEETANMHSRNVNVIKVGKDGLGVAAINCHDIRIWSRVVDIDTSSSWVLSSTIPWHPLIDFKWDLIESQAIPKFSISCVLEEQSVLIIRTPEEVYALDYVKTTAKKIMGATNGRTLFPYNSYHIGGVPDPVDTP